MTTPTIDLATAGSRIEEIERAARDVEQGAIIALPTDTMFALAANAADPGALDTLWSLMPEHTQRSTLAWHLPSPSRVIELLDVRAPVHLRLLKVLSPGQVTFALPASREKLGVLRERTGVAEDVFDDGAELLFRIPAHACALTLLDKTSVPVVMASIPGSAERRPRNAAEAAEALHAAGAIDRVARIISDEHPPLGRQSTLLRLTPDNGFDIARQGACEERYIRRQLTRHVLFVCSGNTCRSPMAQAIATSLFKERFEHDVPTVALSAGTFAGEGSPATHEARTAVEAMGVTLHAHASRPLTRELLDQADAVLCMTSAHADAIRSIDARGSDRVRLLDPNGVDIPDPLGSSQTVYNEAAGHIREAIEKQLEFIATL